MGKRHKAGEEPHGVDAHGRPFVIRWVVAHLGRDGMMTLADPAQGRYTFDGPEGARARRDAILGGNTRERLAEVYPHPDTLTVRACECYPDHHDPIGVYFDD